MFEHFFDLLFELFKILPCTLPIKVRGLILFNDPALKSWTSDMYHTMLGVFPKDCSQVATSHGYY